MSEHTASMDQETKKAAIIYPKKPKQIPEEIDQILQLTVTKTLVIAVQKEILDKTVF
ncbi:MAG: hypothetical protein ACLUQ0_08645 [Enterococcus italicus]|uniref:hypothetical protein n=1 Tax=Enterococcus italicus TaxID=246144 RepID=UPI0028A9787F|nr:hypothetical protein [Enterococcus italicus]